MPSPLRRGRATAAIAVIAAATVSLAACSSSGSSGDSSPGGSGATSGSVAAAQAFANRYLKAPTAITQTVPVPRTPPKGRSIIFLNNGQSDTVKIGAGIQAAAKAISWTYKSISFDVANPATLVTALNNALQAKPAAVVEAGTAQSQISGSILAAYRSAKVPLILASVAPVTPTDPIVGPAGDEHGTALQGKILANWFVADSHGHGKAVMESVTAFPVLVSLADSFTSTVKKLCSACSVKKVNVSISQLTGGQLVPTVVSELRSNPDYKYLFFDQYEFSPGINAALNAAGLKGIKIGGNGFGPDQAAALKAGTQSVWSTYSPYYNGYQTVDLAIRRVEGVPLTTNNATLPTQLITKANVGNLKNTWNRPTDALAQFEKLWKVPTTPCTLACD